MSQIEGKFDIVLSNFVATDIYVLFNNSVKKLQQWGGGAKGFFDNVKKNCTIGTAGFP